MTKLVSVYQRRVYALVGRMLVAAPELVDDVAQETFLKVFAALPRFEQYEGPEGASDRLQYGKAKLSTWILTIATRLSIDVLRHPRLVSEAEDPGMDLSPEDLVSTQELGERVAKAMGELPPEQRAVLVLRAYHDLDYNEIADLLEISKGTVKSRLSRARRALKVVMGEEK